MLGRLDPVVSYGDGLKRNKNGILCLRVVIPPDVRKILGRTEISVSLGTPSRRLAEVSRLELLATVKRAIRAARERVTTNEKMSEDLIRRLVDKRRIEALRGELDEADQSLREKDLQLAKLQQVIVDRLSSAPGPSVAAIPASAKLCDAIDAFLTEGKIRNAWTPKTREKWVGTLALLSEWFGQSCVLGAISRTEMLGLFQAIQRLPKNRRKSKHLAALTIREQIESAEYERISSSTVNQLSGSWETFFGWCTRDVQWGLSTNIAQGLQLGNVQKIKRRAFYDSEVRALLSAPEWKSRTFLHRYMYWALPLGLLAGARVNELAQLDLSDIDVIDGIPVLHLCEDKRQKTENAPRTVPLHSHLLRLGFLRDVERLREAGETQLFPELHDARDGHGRAVSQWFGKFKNRAGVADKVAVFHSARHWFSSALLNSGFDALTVVPALMGHTGKTEAVRTYWTRKELEPLQVAVESVACPALFDLVPPVETMSFGVSVHAGRKPRKETGARRV